MALARKDFSFKSQKGSHAKYTNGKNLVVIPMIFKQEKESGYSICAYDIKGVNTQGEIIAEALSMAEDALKQKLNFGS